MRANEKAKAQRVIERIQAGRFDENDVDSLFMRLRAYSPRRSVFRETADFVAHNDVRDEGILNESLEAFHLSLKFFLDHGYQGKQLDIGVPFPMYIKKLMKYEVGKCEPEELKRRFNVTPERLKARIDTLFKDNKASKTTEIQSHKLSRDSLEPIDYLLGTIRNPPAFTADALINDLFSVLQMNKLVYDESAIRAQTSTIILCVMLLIHKIKFTFEDGMHGVCSIGIERSKGSPPDYDSPEYAKLYMMGVLDIIRPDGRPMSITFPIFRTGLLATEYCDASLFSRKIVPKTLELCVWDIDLEGLMLLTEEGKIGRI